MNSSAFDWDNAHKLVDGLIQRGYNVRWDGWDIVFWEKNPKGMTYPVKGNRRGTWRGQWGIETRFSPTPEGNWVIPQRYVNS